MTATKVGGYQTAWLSAVHASHSKGTIALRALLIHLRISLLLMLSSSASVAGQKPAMEIFIFLSNGGVNALSNDKTGANLPSNIEGWNYVGTLGDFSDKFSYNEISRLHSDGYLILNNQNSESMSKKGWRKFPPNTFRFTAAASKIVREAYDALSSRTGKQCVVSLNWEPVSVKDKNSPQWRDLGVQLTIGGFRQGKVPPEAVDYVDEVPIVLLFDPKSLPNPRPAVIDYGPNGLIFVKSEP